MNHVLVHVEASTIEMYFSRSQATCRLAIKMLEAMISLSRSLL